MSDRLLDAPCPPGAGRALTAGFGRAAPTAARLVTVRSAAELERHVGGAAAAGTPVLVRGLGRSYGDAAQCAGGLLLEATGLDRVLEADLTQGVVRVEAGASLARLLELVVPAGWFLPVTPGTAQVTLGGAIAADVHGKNHHRDGTIAAFVDHLSLVTARGRRELSPAEDADVFWATVGGMGLTGAIADVRLRLRAIETAAMLVETERAAGIEETMSKLEGADRAHRYSVAWVDGAAGGRRLGRGVVSGGDHARLVDLPARARADPLRYAPSRRITVPAAPPLNLVRPAVVAAWNELWFRRAPVRRVGALQEIGSFFHPLDAAGGWNRLYGPLGFTQYQFAVPFGAEGTLRAALETLQRHHLVPGLCVLKRFGAADPAPLSFPLPGWTLAVDVPLGGAALGPALDLLDELVAGAGGRVYLAKDGRLRPDLLATMYPRLGEWQAARSRADPGGVFVSDLWRRLAPHAAVASGAIGRGR